MAQGKFLEFISKLDKGEYCGKKVFINCAGSGAGFFNCTLTSGFAGGGITRLEHNDQQHHSKPLWCLGKLLQ